MTKYDELAQVTQIMLEQDLDKHRRSLAQSRSIAGELAQIDAMRAAAQADGGSISARQMLGADTLWQGWMAQKRSEIQRRAALARAQEADTLAHAQLAFSRQQAAESLVKEARLERMRKLTLAEAERIDALGHLRRAIDPQEF